MRARERRVRGLLGWSAALLVAAGLAAAVPATSSAFTAEITNSANSAVSKAEFTCADTFAGDRRRSSAYFEFALSEPADSTTASDSSDAQNSGTYRGSNTKDATTERAATTACPNDSGTAYRLDGSTSRISTDRQYPPILGNVSVEVWFKTSSAGKLLGFEQASDGGSSNYDKHLYVDTNGAVVYGVFDNGVHTLASSNSVTDGAWHYAVGTTSAKGSVLYLDGQRVAGDESFTTAENYPGYWRIGSGLLGGWPNNPSSTAFTGSMRFAAAYSYALTAGEVASAWSIGKPGSVRRVDPEPTATATVTPMPEATATPTATESPAPGTTATPVPGPVRSEAAPTYAPAPGSSDISTVPDQQ